MATVSQEIISLVGQPTDLAAKYENFKPDPETGDDGIMTSLDSLDSDEITGEKIAQVANFVKDKTINEIIEKLQHELPVLFGEIDDEKDKLAARLKENNLLIRALVERLLPDGVASTEGVAVTKEDIDTSPHGMTIERDGAGGYVMRLAL